MGLAPVKMIGRVLFPVPRSWWVFDAIGPHSLVFSVLAKLWSGRPGGLMARNSRLSLHRAPCSIPDQGTEVPASHTTWPKINKNSFVMPKTKQWPDKHSDP